MAPRIIASAGVPNLLRVYNTLSKTVDQVTPIDPGRIRMYSCGPTVYRDSHIGNLRTYLMADWIRRALEGQGIVVDQVKNITDVGHMRQEMLERGEDKIVAAAIEEGKTPEEITDFYTDRFLVDETKLNIRRANWFPKATDHVGEMVHIVERLVENGNAYVVDGNVYFEVSSFPDYGKLSGNIHETGLLEAVRIDVDPNKRDARDFTLWKKSEEGRILKWPSPWGDGFPGWHIECSAMSIKYLGRRFDIHTGGVDNIFPHHEGEISQSEAFTGGRVVNIWVHGQHLLADGVKMAKSSGNSFILSDIETQGIDPLAFRYLCMTVRYRSRLNFTFTSLKAAQRGLQRLKDRVWTWSLLSKSDIVDPILVKKWRTKILERVEDNLDLPGALALAWKLARSDLSGRTKLQIMEEFDEQLGLGLRVDENEYMVPTKVQTRLDERTVLRNRHQYDEADMIREELGRLGFVIQDTLSGSRVRSKACWEEALQRRDTVSSSADVPTLIYQSDAFDVTIGIVANNYLEDVKRCVTSALHCLGGRHIETVIVNNGSTDDITDWLEELARSDIAVRVIHTDHILGEAMAKNILLKQSLGRTIVLLDTSVEVIGDIMVPIEKLLESDGTGVTGPFGLRTDDLNHFHDGESEAGLMDAMQAYCFAFRRHLLRDVGLMRESFRFYRNLDIDYSFQFKDKGYDIWADPTIPVFQHEHKVWNSLDKGEREKLSRRNYRKFLDRWGNRTDLLISGRATS